MKAVTVKELKVELENRSPRELRELCIRLSRFKKENKELMTYLLFESSDEVSYIENVKEEIDLHFKQINKKSNYFIKKGIRRALSITRKYIRYSKKRETEIELLIYYCSKLKKITHGTTRNTGIHNIYLRQIEAIRQKITLLHEDLQYDYGITLNELVS